MRWCCINTETVNEFIIDEDRLFMLFGINMWNRLFLAVGLWSFTTALIGCGQSFSREPDNKPVVLPATVIRTQTQSEYSFSITFYGRIQSVRRSLLSFEVPGQIISLLIDEGETVKVNQLIARLDTSILEAEKQKLIASIKVEQSILLRLENGEREEVIAAAHAMVMRMEAETERANLDRDRVKKLRIQNATTQTEYEEALYEARSLQASLDAAKARFRELESGTRSEDVETQKNRINELDAQVDLVNVRIQKADLAAPFAAHVMKRLVDEGTVVRGGEPVFAIAEFEQLEARFSVPIEQLAEAKTATSVHVGGVNHPVKKSRVIPSVSPRTRTVDIVFHLKQSKNIIEGQACTLTLVETVRTRCIKLPISALVPSLRGLWSCYRLEKEKSTNAFRVIREELTVNHTDGDQVFVEASLPDDSVIVCEGAHKLVPGMLVHPKDAN